MYNPGVCHNSFSKENKNDDDRQQNILNFGV